MKKVLIVIHDMEIGGAQKSLLSFLQSFSQMPQSGEYTLYLTAIKPSGAFYKEIPQNVKRHNPSGGLRFLGTPLSLQLLKHFSLRGFIGKMKWIFGKGKAPKELNLQQKLWHCWKKYVPEESEEFDVAIAYMDGAPSYYVMDKVRARKKILWVHNEYQKLGYNPQFDAPYFQACDKIITISQSCRACLVQAFPDLEDRIVLLENISGKKMIEATANAERKTLFDGVSGLRLLSVGRLNTQKGFDIALNTAALLKEKGILFTWVILGEGPLRQELEQLRGALGLEDAVLFPGATDNPYVYMKKCDILVQSSRFEGKSIVLDEAKLLAKPIVSTNYNTVGDSLTHGQTGYITEMDADSLCEGICTVASDSALRCRLENNLRQQEDCAPLLTDRYIEIML